MRVIAGKFKGHTLKTPKSKTTRPTQGMLREAVFNICQNEVEGARFLDLFAGSGAMGIEALSRGALHATFVEQNRSALQCMRENLSLLQLKSSSTLIPYQAKSALTSLSKKNALFDLIYVDPPYDLAFDLGPVASLLAPSGILFFEQRYNPKKQEQTFDLPGVQLKDARKFGAAILFIFNHSLQ